MTRSPLAKPSSNTDVADRVARAGMPKPSFWRGRRVFLTGHTGFKGSWLSLWLNSLGANVTGWALEPPTNPSLFELADVESALHSVRGDIRDFPSLKTAVA